MERALTRYRFRITLAGYGNDERSAESLLDGFADTHPEVGPVVSQDVDADTLTIVFSLEAGDPNVALDLGRPIFLEGVAASQLEPVELIEINVSLISPGAEKAGSDRELQPA